MRLASLVLVAFVSVACREDEEPARVRPPAQPVRGAVADTDLRVMLAEIASARACEKIRGTFRGLRASDRDVIAGVLWIRECAITNDGTKVRFELSGQGWRWSEKSQETAGAEFVVRDYVKFAVEAAVEGTLDIAYDRDSHIVSVWFSPTKSPAIRFEPLGDIPVDEQGLWGSIVGGVATLASESPEQRSKDKADKQGTRSFAEELAQGITVAIDLCTGYQRFTLGRVPKGKLGPPDPGESQQRPVEIQPEGLIVLGPYEAPRGMHVDVEASGPIRVGLACIDDVYAAARAFIAEQPQPRIDTLAQRDIRGAGVLSIEPARCRVALVVRSLAREPVTFGWERPAREIARSSGGRVIHCKRKQTVSSERDGSAGRTAARRR